MFVLLLLGVGMDYSDYVCLIILFLIERVQWRVRPLYRFSLDDFVDFLVRRGVSLSWFDEKMFVNVFGDMGIGYIDGRYIYISSDSFGLVESLSKIMLDKGFDGDLLRNGFGGLG